MQEVIGLVGLGYVGLPLAVAFAAKYKVIGFDAKEKRIQELRAGKDSTREVEPSELKSANLVFTADPAELAACTFIVVAVPTPINEFRDPDLTCLEQASETVGKILRKGMMVVYESTVYPGVTEESCLPILEKVSGLKLGDFDLGYSPERINPGDKEHTVTKITKVVSGHSPASLERCARVYGSVIAAGVHRAATIMTAEASKVIENVQRDLNIALMNELSKIFARMGLNTRDVLAASGTKWNFHRYHPGLVGGHCIGVDPYYLTKRAIDLGYNPEVILAGRRINDGMGEYVATQVIRRLNHARRLPSASRVWVMGMTFKEDVPDCRNTRAIDVVRALQAEEVEVSVWEPLLTPEEVKRRFNVDTVAFEDVRDVDAIVLINGHKVFRGITLAQLRERMRTPVLFDVKNFFDRDEAAVLGIDYQSL
jgi:UDP-N-acetyl-D-galactosamine dehydrogenase